MGLLTRVLSGASIDASGQPRPDDWDDRWYDGSLDGRWAVSSSGVPMSPEMALRLSAVWAAVRILVEGIAALPCIVYQSLGDNGGKKRARGHPLYELLRWQPNTWQTAIEFWEMMMGHVVLRGNAYAQIVPGARGAVDQLIPRHPDRMKVESIQTPRGMRLRYTWTPPQGPPVPLTQDEVFHIRGLSSDGITGLVLADHARDSFGLSKAAGDYGAAFFRRGATVQGILEHPKAIVGPAQENIKRSVESQMRNPHGIMVLEEGMTWKNIGFNAKDTQLIESLNFGVHEVARWFNVPLHLLREALQPTYASIEMFDLELVIHTLRPWAVRIEQAIRRDLITGFDTYFAEFLMDALMRGDSQARATYYASGITNGWLTRNEARQKENMNELDGLSVPLVPMNMGDGTKPPVAQDTAGQAPPTTSTGRAERLAAASVDRILRRELAAVTKAVQKHAGDAKAYQGWAETFYAEHATFVADALAIPLVEAAAYCTARRESGYLRTEITQADRDTLVALALQEYDDVTRPAHTHAA
jgi:HK97 family phage portal protein